MRSRRLPRGATCPRNRRGIGRTGRAGKSGIAITLITPREYKQLRQIERTARTVIDRKKLPSRAEVLRAREKNIASDIAGIIRENRHEGYLPLAAELANDFGLDHIAAAGLCAAFGDIRRKPAADSCRGLEDLAVPITVDGKGGRNVSGKSSRPTRQKNSRFGRKRDKKSGNAFQRRRRRLS